MKAAVVGCGVVGGTMLGAHPSTVGYDIDPSRVAALRAAGLTVDYRPRILAAADIIFICVGTPNHDGVQDPTPLRSALQTVAYHAKHPLVVIRSTILPAHLPVDYPFPLAVNPEFLREATRMEDLRDPPFVVAGVSDPQHATPIFAWHDEASVVCDRHLICSPVEALLLKYACNWFHAIKVEFANMVGDVAMTWGADHIAVMSLFAQDAKLNLSPAYLTPGRPFGGSCLPKDVVAGLGSLPRSMIRLLWATWESNQRRT